MKGDLFSPTTHNRSGSRVISAKVVPRGGVKRGRSGGVQVTFGSGAGQQFDANSLLRFGSTPYGLNRLRDAVQRSTQMKSFFQMAKRGVLNSKPITPLMASLRPQALQERVLRLWQEFERAPTTIGRPSMLEVQEGLIESVLTDGMAFFLRRNSRSYPHGFALLPVGREYLLEGFTNIQVGRQDRNPIVAGLEFDRNSGRLVAYWFARSMTEVWRRNDPHRTLFMDNTAVRESRVRVPVEQVIAVMTSERHDEIVSHLPQAVLGLVTAQGLDRIDKATIKTMEVASKVAAVIKKDVDAPIDDDAADDEAVDMDNLLESGELPDGASMELPAGYSMDAFQTDWPNMAGDVGRKAILRNLASCMGIAYAELANDAEASNFANTRTFSILTRERWRRMALMVTEQFVRPTMEAWLEAVELQGLIPSLRPGQRAAILQTNFTIRAYQSVDPFKDAQADNLRLAQFATSPQRILAQSGQTIDEILDDFLEVGRKIRERDEANNGDLSRGLSFLAAFSATPAVTSVEVEDPETGNPNELDIPPQSSSGAGA